MSTISIHVPTRGMLSNTLTLARRELRDALASRWFILYSLAFVGLGLCVSYVSASSAGSTGLEGFGRTSAGLANLVQLVVPLMALGAGAGSIAGDRERGMLLYMLAQPVARFEVLLSKYLALATALSMSISFGFGVCALVIATHTSAAQPGGFVLLAGLTILLMMAMLSVGMLISVVCRRTAVATGVAIFVWLAMVFLTDFGLMAVTLASQISIESLFAAATANPLQVYKMWSLQRVDASLDVLGPAGLYAQTELGSTVNWIFALVMGGWIILPLFAAAWLFRRKAVV